MNVPLSKRNNWLRLRLLAVTATDDEVQKENEKTKEMDVYCFATNLPFSLSLVIAFIIFVLVHDSTEGLPLQNFRTDLRSVIICCRFIFYFYLKWLWKCFGKKNAFKKAVKSQDINAYGNCNKINNNPKKKRKLRSKFLCQHLYS